MRTVYRTVTRRAGRARRRAGMSWKRVAKGAAIGTGISVGGYLLGRYLVQSGRPEGIYALEAGQRIGSIASAKWGGWVGNAVFQGIDAAIDRFVQPRGGGQFGSGSQGASFI